MVDDGTGTNILAIVVIVLLILLVISVFIWSSINPPPEIDEGSLPDFNAIFTSSLSTEWSETSSEDCLKYTFIYPDQPTLNKEVLDSMEGVPIKKNPCVYSDELYANKITRECNASVCTDDSGNTYSQGDTQVLYNQCLNNSCSTLALISLGFDPNGDPNANNVCITQTSPLSLTPCDPSNKLQLFAYRTQNTQFAEITNKEGLCIVKGSDNAFGTSLVMGPCPSNPFTWDLLNSKYYTLIDPDITHFVPQQIVFWTGPIDQTVPAIDIVLADPRLTSMAINLVNVTQVSLEDVIIDTLQDPGNRFNTQILDYSFYDYIITQPTQPLTNATTIPFYSNLQEIFLPL